MNAKAKKDAESKNLHVLKIRAQYRNCLFCSGLFVKWNSYRRKWQ